MALLAGHGRVRAKQREAILVILYLLHGNVPALDRVALLAIRTHLPAVNIRVAVGAILSHVGEDRFYVALNARYFFVHAAQWIVRLVVIKLRHRADRTPARRRVTVFAWNRQRPVRAPRGFLVFLGLNLPLGRRLPGDPDRRLRSNIPPRSSGGRSSERRKSQKCPECELEQGCRRILPAQG